MASGNRAMVGRILAVAAALMFIGAGVVYAGTLPIEPAVRHMLGVVLAGIGVTDTLLAVYFILTDPS